MHVAPGRGCETPYSVWRPFTDPMPDALDESATAAERLKNHVRPRVRPVSNPGA